MRRRLVAATGRRTLACLLVLAGGAAGLADLAGCRSAVTARHRNWKQDVAYLARKLPMVHVRGLTNVSRKGGWQPRTASSIRCRGSLTAG